MIPFKEINNRKALHDYEVLQEHTAGMVLHSHLVKLIAYNRWNLTGAYVRHINNELFLIGDHCFDTTKLLLNRREINGLIGKVREKGLSIVPIRVFKQSGKFKVRIALVRGKKLHDKRDADKKRDVENENRRIVKSQKLSKEE